MFFTKKTLTICIKFFFNEKLIISVTPKIIVFPNPHHRSCAYPCAINE